MQKDNLPNTKRLAINEDYYTNVFKRTERTASTIFYILSFITETESNSFFIKDGREKTMAVLSEVLATLSFYEFEAADRLFTFQQSIVSLEGTLRIGNASRILTDETLDLVLNEFDLVQRFMRENFSTSAPKSIFDDETPLFVTSEPSSKFTPASVSAQKTNPSANTQPSSRKRRVNIPAGDISSDAHLVYSQLVDRTTRILTVLEAKPEATIKDIAEVITDIGEKTIQRELNSLIEKGQVVREGERRWSKYSVAK